ncbi:MAG: hypothetical protein ACW99A_22725, partial [Candidatus Kariarchaeaceae archaeon]
MSVSQLAICGICKQDVVETTIDENLINCNMCKASYHKNHLQIWLQIEKDCPVCREDIQKLAFVEFAIKHKKFNTTGELYNQLEDIFPKGIPKPLFEWFIQKFPKGIPNENFLELKRKHNRKKFEEVKLKKRDKDNLETTKQLEELTNWILIISLIIFFALYFFIQSFFFSRELLRENIYLSKIGRGGVALVGLIISLSITVVFIFTSVKMWNSYNRRS